jgi:hypothetical protein
MILASLGFFAVVTVLGIGSCFYIGYRVKQEAAEVKQASNASGIGVRGVAGVPGAFADFFNGPGGNSPTLSSWICWDPATAGPDQELAADRVCGSSSGAGLSVAGPARAHVGRHLRRRLQQFPLLFLNFHSLSGLRGLPRCALSPSTKPKLPRKIA